MANEVSTPTQKRCVTSYAVRTQYKPGPIHPPHITVKDAIDIHCHVHDGHITVKDAIDIHCHVHDGQQDPFHPGMPPGQR